jgi:uncharacterized protein
MKTLVEDIAKALVDFPADVRVNVVEGAQVTIFELRTHPSDIGKVVGRDGRIAKAIRILLTGVGVKLHKRFALEILEDQPHPATNTDRAHAG